MSFQRHMVVWSRISQEIASAIEIRTQDIGTTYEGLASDTEKQERVGCGAFVTGVWQCRTGWRCPVSSA